MAAIKFLKKAMLASWWLAAFACATFAAYGGKQEARFERLTPRPPTLHTSDFRLAASQTLPEVESYQQVVFSGSISGIPKKEGIDRFTAPPFTVVLHQAIAVFDRATGASYCNGQASGGATVSSPASLVWEPGQAVISTETSIARLRVEQVALRSPQGFVFKINVQNPVNEKRALVLATVEQPVIRRPREWTYAPQWARPNQPAAPANLSDGIVVHDAGDGAVAIGFEGATGVAAPSTEEALKIAAHGKSGGAGTASSLYRTIDFGPGESRYFFLVITISTSRTGALEAARKLLANPEGASAAAKKLMDDELEGYLKKLPALIHPDPRVVRFYRQAALQLLYDRWKVGKTFILDPWYPSLGLDSGGLNSYAWDFSYSAVPLTLMDPTGMRAMLIALLSAPLTEHYSIDPVTGAGTGPFYSYNPYAFTSAVDTYLRATGDRSILQERMKGKTVLEWLIDMAQFGENDRDPDGNHLIDYGDDHNLLEIKTTGNGPGYIHEVPSPNGERSYVYQTVADLLEEEHDSTHAALITKFLRSAAEVRRAVNDVLWMDDVGWYGTRQKDGKVVAIYSIQVFDLLRIPGLVPPDRARRLLAHLNDGEFLGPWGPRSLSIQDRLWDWRDHDWSGPMTYIGDGPQLTTDLYKAGYVAAGWKVLERMLWWPEHLAIYPQGIANDDYSSRYPQSKRFGGRISAGRANEISGCVGVDTVISGLFGISPERDGSIGFSSGRRPQDGPMAIAYPFRGKTWTITQRREGLDALRSDGFDATLFREDGSLRFHFTPQALFIRAAARSGGPGRLSVAAGGNWRHAKLNGKRTTVHKVHGRLIFDLPNLAGHGAEVMLEH